MGACSMTFQDPSFLHLGVGLTALIMVGLWSHAGRRRRLAEFLGGQRAVDRLSRSNLYRLRIERALFLGLGGLALAIAAAEPRWLEFPEPGLPVKQVILAIDVSASMQAADVSPTRLARSVGVAGELVDALEDHRVGLLLFAGTGYPLAPPTHDHEALRFLLGGITPTIASSLDPGTLLSVGIEEGVELLERPTAVAVRTEGRAIGADLSGQELVGEKLIVLIGDGETGENDDGVSRAIEVAREAGIGIHTVGVGTTSGAGMIMPSGTYQLGGPVLDATGTRGMSQLREPLLREVAAAGGGQYVNASSETELRALRVDLEDPSLIPDLSPGDGVPIWARYDLSFLLGLGALLLILAEGMLDVTLPWDRSTRRLRLG